MILLPYCSFWSYCSSLYYNSKSCYSFSLLETIAKMGLLLYCSLLSYHSFNYCNSKSYCSFSLWEALVLSFRYFRFLLATILHLPTIILIVRCISKEALIRKRRHRNRQICLDARNVWTLIQCDCNSKVCVSKHGCTKKNSKKDK